MTLIISIAMKSQLFTNEIKYHINLRKPKANKPTTVFFVVVLDKKQVRLTTQTKVYPEHWDKERQQAYISVRLTERDNINNEIVNERLNEIRDEFQKFKQYLCEHPLDDIDKIDLLSASPFLCFVCFPILWTVLN